MPGIDDWTITPHRVVDRLFDECGVDGGWREKTKQYFQDEIKRESVIKKLPWVNETPLHDLRTNQVVRFRGMVQDMFDSEFFLDVYQVRDTKGGTRLQAGRFKDVAECGVGETIVPDSPACVTGDRLVYYCVPIPGESPWVKEIYREQNPGAPSAGSSCTAARNKRPAGGDDCVEGPGGSDGIVPESMECMESDASNPNDAKRSRGESESGEVGQSNSNTTTAPSTTTTTTSASSTTTPTTPCLNFPLPGMTGTPCLVKLYDGESFSLNDLIEVVGVLSVDPSLAATNTPGGTHDGGPTTSMEVEEEAANSLPPSLVPRLHVLSVRVMSHAHPLLPCPAPAPPQPRETREQLRLVLKEACLGDALAADLLICHLLSSVYLRKDVIALGKYSVNLSGIKPGLVNERYCQRLYSIISRLVTQAHHLPLTINTMNTTKFIPKKDYQANRLTSGVLQLPSHTHLVLDETCLTAGQLDANGVHSLTALGNLINWQKVDYDFQFHNIEQLANVPVLILSEGRAMISCDAEIRLEPKETDVAAAFQRAERLLTPELLQDIRVYLTTARLLSYTLDDDMQKLVQDDFVESRKRDNKGISAEDLHHLLVLARLVSVSCGETSLTQDVWRSAKILDSERKLRLNNNQQNN